MVQRLQHRMRLEFVAVGQTPLQFANPHRYPRQFGGVLIELNPKHVVRPGHQIGLAVQPQGGGLQVAAVLNVFERFEPEKQKIATAAGRVEHAVVTQVVQPLDEPGLRGAVVFVAFLATLGQQLLQDMRRLIPKLQQGAFHHRLDDAQDGGGVGVVGAELAAFGRVQTAFEQRAEDGNVDGAPVEVGGIAQLGHVQYGECGHVNGLEQAAVEPRNFVGAKHAAVGHGGEQVAQTQGEFVAGDFSVGDQPLEHAPRQQAHVFGKKAEQALRQKVGNLVGAQLHGLGVIAGCCATSAQPFGQGGKAAGGGLGDVAVGDLGLEALGGSPDPAQQGELVGLVDVRYVNFVRFARVSGELGVNADGQPV